MKMRRTLGGWCEDTADRPFTTPEQRRQIAEELDRADMNKVKLLVYGTRGPEPSCRYCCKPRPAA